jgi:WD40 repeat protein
MSNPKPSQKIYTTSGAVQADGGLYISRKADDELFNLCQASAFTYVLTPRQLGKSSLMYNTATRLHQEGIESVLIDISPVGGEVTAEEWYFGLLDDIKKQLNLKTDEIKWWQAHAHLGFSQRLVLFLKEVLLSEIAKPIVIFVDEIDTTLNLSFTDDFYAAIRYLYTARAVEPRLHRLSFVLIGVATPSDLIRDPKRTPFNIGHCVDLTDFTLDEAMPLAAGLNLPSDKARQVLEWVLTWTEGHPYLTQRLCRALAEQKQSQISKSDVDRMVTNIFFGEMSKQDHNILFVRDMLTERALNPVEVLTVYRAVLRNRPSVADDESSLLKSHLKLSGIVRSKNDKLQVRNRIYKEFFNQHWIQEHLPINWAKRLRKAAIGAIATLILLSLPVGAFALYQWKKASERNEELQIALARVQEEGEKTKQQKLIAEEKTKLAEASRIEAETQRKIAKDNERRADASRIEAEKQRAIAEENEQRAEVNRKEAERQTAIAKDNEQRADASRIEAEQQTTLAVNARKEAEKAKDDLQIQKDVVTKQNIELVKQKAALEEQKKTISEQKAQVDKYLAIVKGLDASVPHYGGIIRGENSPAKNAAFASDNKHLAMVCADGKVYVSDDGKEYGNKRIDKLQDSTEKENHGKTAIAFGGDNNHVFVASDKNARFENATGGMTSSTLQSYRGSIKNTALSPDGKRIFTISKKGAGNILDAISGKELATLKKSDGSIYNAASVYQVVFSKHGELVFTAGKTNNNKSEAYVWDAKTGLEKNHLDPSNKIASDKMVSIAAFSPTLEYLATVSNEEAYVWRINNGAKATFKYKRTGHQEKINTLDFNRDGKRIVTASDDGTAWVWEANTGRKVVELRDHKGILISFQRGKLDFVTLKALLHFRFRNNLPMSFENLRRPDLKRITGAAFDPEANLVVTTNEIGAVKLWDAETGKPVMELRGHTKSVNSAAFSSNGRLIITASDDGTARVWDICATNNELLNVSQPNKPGKKNKPTDPFDNENLKQLCSTQVGNHP